MKYLPKEVVSKLQDAAEGLSNDGLLSAAKLFAEISTGQEDFERRMMDTMRFSDEPGGEIDRLNDQNRILFDHFDR